MVSNFRHPVHEGLDSSFDVSCSIDREAFLFKGTFSEGPHSAAEKEHQKRHLQLPSKSRVRLGALVILATLWSVSTPTVADAEIKICETSGTLANAESGPYKGRAFDLLRIAEIRDKHMSLTSKDLAWMRNLDGPSPENRLFRLDGATVLVFSSCKARACDKESMYGAMDTRDKSYGIEVSDRSGTRVLGILSRTAQLAIQCARSFDRQLADRARHQIRQNTK